jgi:hypothetical protein
MEGGGILRNNSDGKKSLKSYLNNLTTSPWAAPKEKLFLLVNNVSMAPNCNIASLTQGPL